MFAVEPATAMFATDKLPRVLNARRQRRRDLSVTTQTSALRERGNGVTVLPHEFVVPGQQPTGNLAPEFFDLVVNPSRVAPAR